MNIIFSPSLIQSFLAPSCNGSLPLELHPKHENLKNHGNVPFFSLSILKKEKKTII